MRNVVMLLSFVCCGILQGFPTGVPYTPSPQEKLALSQWQAGKYKTALFSLPLNKQPTNALMCFTSDNEHIAMKLLLPVYGFVVDEYFLSFDMKAETWKTLQKYEFDQQFSDDLYAPSGYEFDELCQKYVKKELGAVMSLNFTFKPHHIFRDDYRICACLVNYVYFVLLELHQEPPVREMRKAHDVNFCFAKVD